MQHLNNNKTEDMFSKIFHASPDGFIISRISDGKIIQVNGSAETIFEYRAEEMLGKTSVGMGLFADPKERERAVGILKENGFLRDFSVRILRKSGELREVSLAVELLDIDGEKCMLTSVRDITERRRAETEAVTRAVELETILNSIADAVIVYDNEGKIIRKNTAADDILNYPKEDLDSSMIESVKERYGMWSEDGTKLKPEEMPAKRAVTNGETIKNMVVKVRGAGKPRWVNSSAAPLIVGGRQVGAVATLSDITERKQAEEILAFHAALLLNINDAITATDKDFRFTYWNKVAEDMFGWTADEAIGQIAPELLQTKVESSTRAKIVDELFRNGNYRGEVFYKRKNGTYLPAEVSSTVIKNSELESIGILSTVRDITERKRAQQALLESEERFSKAFTLNPGALILSRLDDERITEVNEAFTRVFGYARDEVIGRTPLELNLSDPEERAGLISQMKRNGFIRDVEVKFHRKNAKELTCLFSAEILRVSSQESILSSIQDITEIKNTQMQLRHTIAELERSNYDLERFAFAASHDLQEPIRMMGSYAQLLINKYKEQFGSDADKYLKFMFEGAVRLQTLIRDLLYYSRLRTEQQRAYVDLNKTVNAVTEELKDEIAQKNAYIKYNLLPAIFAHPAQMKQLFKNLISNALKFSKAEVSPVIEIFYAEKQNEWIFEVSDNGIGIDPENIKLIFTILQRLNSCEEYPGVGVGLAICKRIVERHEGKIWVESSPGKGSIFYFTIPKILEG